MDDIKVNVKKEEEKVEKTPKRATAPKKKTVAAKSRRGIVKILATVLVTAAVAGGAIYAWQSKNLESSVKKIGDEARNARLALESEMDNLKNKLQGQESENETLKKEKEELTAQTKLLAAAQVEFSEPSLGLSFYYPAVWGEVQASTTKGETGNLFRAGFSNNDKLVFGGISRDYSAGRDGGFLDSQGYIKKSSRYYYLFVTAKPETSYEIKPLKIISAAGSDVLVVDKASFITEKDVTGPQLNPGENKIGALINLKTANWGGLAFWNQDPQGLPPAEFEKMLASIKVNEVK